MSMVDIIFYKDKISVQNLIAGYKNIMNAPNVGEIVTINGTCYKVSERVFDFDGNTIHIVVEDSRRRFMR